MSTQTAAALSHVETTSPYYQQAIDEICNLNWTKLTEEDIIRVAWAYYHFSVQFRECLEIARKMYPDDERLLQLDHGERNTDNLSPWPGVAATGEKINHDEFMRRTLELAKIPETGRIVLSDIGKKYLKAVRAIDPKIQALALATYEDGGLERVFRAILTAPNWNGPLQQAFKHFLAEHIRFDSDPDQGHGALCRHLTPDDRCCLYGLSSSTCLSKPPLISKHKSSASGYSHALDRNPDANYRRCVDRDHDLYRATRLSSPSAGRSSNPGQFAPHSAVPGPQRSVAAP